MTEIMKDSYFYYGVGMDNLEKGNIQEALVNFVISLTLSQHFKTYEQLYHTLNNLGYKEESELMIEKAYQLNSNNDKVSLIYAKCLINKGDKGKAKDILVNLLVRNKTYLPARMLLEQLDYQ